MINLVTLTVIPTHAPVSAMMEARSILGDGDVGAMINSRQCVRLGEEPHSSSLYLGPKMSLDFSGNTTAFAFSHICLY